MDYLKEPFDFKLFAYKMLGKWYQFAMCAIVGAVLFGGSYYLWKVTYAPAKEFKASSVYYIEYALDPKLDEPYSYFNDYTLNSWLTTDIFTSQVMPKLGKELTAEQLDKYVELTLDSDVRVMKLTVVTPDAELAMDILKAYDEAFVTFAESQREVNAVRLQDMSKAAVQIKADIRTQRAFVLGAVLGLFAGAMYIVLQYLLDDGIYLPQILAKRHGLKVLGTNVSEELAANVAYALKDKKKAAVTAVGDTPALPEVLNRLKSSAEHVEWIMVPCMVQCPEAGDVLRDCDGIIVTVVSGRDKSGAVDRAMRYYEQQEITVLGAVLWDADTKLLNRYGK